MRLETTAAVNSHKQRQRCDVGNLPSSSSVGMVLWFVLLLWFVLYRLVFGLLVGRFLPREGNTQCFYLTYCTFTY